MQKIFKMTLILFILLLIAGLGYFLQKNTFASVILTLAILVFWGTGSGLIARGLLSPLNVPNAYTPPEWGARNVLIVLGGGTAKQPETFNIIPSSLSYSRLNMTAMQYFACKQAQHDCKILISGGSALQNGHPEARVYQDNLLRLGVSAQDIMLEDKSKNTFQNAKFSSQILRADKFDKLFLITSSFHMQRCLLYFSHFNSNPTPIAADSLMPVRSVFPKGYNFAIADFAMHEHIGIARYYFYNFMGWNS